jgi:hypothetical protein
VLLLASLIALAAGRKRLHGRINVCFFILTMTAVLGFEVIVRLTPDFTARFSREQMDLLYTHLCFSIPAAVVLPFMLFSGKTHRSWHVKLAILFAVLWTGTFVTGIFYLPTFPGP